MNDDPSDLLDGMCREISDLTQALGLLTTLKPSMILRPEDPIGMAHEIVAEVKKLREQLVEAEETALNRTMLADGRASEIHKLRKIIATHELCHDSDLKVGPRQFLKSCAAYIRGHFSDVASDLNLGRALHEIDKLP